MTDAVDRQNAVTEIEHVWIDMPDGVRLSARLWLPETSDTVGAPAILEYIPYRKRDMVRVRDERNHAYFASHGYACIRVDMRGSGDSEGLKTDMYDPHELDDALCVIDWISRQSWCDGNVGMMGTSWGGTASLQAAARRPAALKAVIAVCATDNRYSDDIHHMGGCLLTDTVEWGATLPGILASPPDPESVGDGWRDMWMQRLEALAFPLEDWVRHETFDAYWRWGSVSETPEAIDCPVLAIGGWVDRYSNTVMNLLADSCNDCWGIIGPWRHQYPDLGCPGPGIGFQQEAVRWWDRWLKGRENGIEREPRLRVWMQNFTSPCDRLDRRPGRWIKQDAWPSPAITPMTLRLSGRALTEAALVDEATATVPWNLGVGRMAGDTGYFGRDGGLPLDQAADDALSMTFETGPLAEAVEILGAPVLSVCCRADREKASVVARLNDVSPTGAVARVSYGIGNLALDENGGVEKLVQPDGVQTMPITMHNTAYRFEAGHRIRLAVSCTYWPMIWPSPEPVDLVLMPGKSELILPVRPVASDEGEVVMSKPVVPPGSPTSSPVCAPALSRKVERDDDSGLFRTGWRQDFTCVRHETIDLMFGYETEGTHSGNLVDPNAACSRFDHRMRFSRKDWQVDVISMAQLESTPDAYRLSGMVRVEENGDVIFERRWSPEVPRRFS